MRDYPAYDSDTDATDVWNEAGLNDAGHIVTAYFDHFEATYSDATHGGINYPVAELRLIEASNGTTYTRDRAVALIGYDAVNRLEEIQTEIINGF